MVERIRSAKTVYRQFKSFLILAFVALAIFQTGQLWFVNLANRNFFLYLTDRWRPSVAEGYREFVRPMRLVYGDGTGRFDISYRDLMDAPPRTYFDAVLSELFASGSFVGVSNTDYARLLSRPVLMFEYAFEMPGNIFPLGFNQRTGGFLAGRGVDYFTAVVIWMPYGDDSGHRVFFVSDDVTWEFSLSIGAVEGLPVTPVSTTGLYFVSAVLEGHDILPPNAFIPRSGDLGRFAYYRVTVVNPYISPAGRNINFVLNQVSSFFDNPATINARPAGDGVWTFSNIHTTVRYFDTDVLEYASFRPRRTNVSSGLMGDFSAALAFIEADDNVINETFLKGFEPRGDGYVFWFGYIVSDFPVLLPDGWRVSSTDDILRAPIEVVVSQRRVVLYRRLAHNFTLDGGYSWMMGMDFDIDEFIRRRAGQDGLDEPIAGLSLGYRVGHHLRPDTNLVLDWLYHVSESEEPAEDK